MSPSLARDEALEVGQPPGNRDRKALGSAHELVLQPPQPLLEEPPSIGELGAIVARDRRRHDLMVEGWDDDLDAVVLHDPHPVEQVLLGRAARAERRTGGSARRSTSS